MSSRYSIVLLGANQAGIPMAHYLLKHTIPHLNLIDQSRTYHLTIVSPNTEYYWKLGSPAAIAGTKNIKTAQLTKPISEILSQYPSSSFQHVLGKATGLDPTVKTVRVTPTTSTETGTSQAKTIAYDSLIVATGSHYDTPLYTTSHGSDALSAAHSKVRVTLPSAKSIVIVGGGPVGVETAGEIALAYPTASITLFSGASRLLERSVPEKASLAAEKQLAALGVKISHGPRVVSAHSEVSTNPGSGEAATINFNDGQQSTADVYIKAMASGKNTSFLPAEWLDEKGNVKADPETLRATGPGADGVYVLGDINQNSDGQFLWASDGIKPAASALAEDILTKLEMASTLKQHKFKTMAGIIVVPVGKGGTGIVKGWVPPAWFVYYMKGKSYLTWLMGDQVSGKAYAKP